MPSKRLPARPNLEHLRTQAKTLLAKLRAGDPEAAGTFIKHLPDAAKLSPTEVRSRGFRLADAQAVIARKTGFAKWPGLARHVERLRSLEGTWTFRSLEIDGSAVPASMLAASILLIDGDRFRMESAEGNYEGVFTIDCEADPATIDIDFVEGPEAGNRCEGVFRLDESAEGDQLTLCLGLVGSSRPDRFASLPGSGHALEVLVRSDAARPAGVDGGTPQPAKAAPPPAPDPFEPQITPTIERLQGEWIPLELITSGSPMQPAYLGFGKRIHTGAETKVVFGGQTMLHARMRVHGPDAKTEPSGEPLAFDYLLLSGSGKGAISHGLFRWEGDEAIFCTAPPGQPRPEDLTCAPGSGRTYSRWKRKP